MCAAAAAPKGRPPPWATACCDELPAFGLSASASSLGAAALARQLAPTTSSASALGSPLVVGNRRSPRSSPKPSPKASPKTSPKAAGRAARGAMETAEALRAATRKDREARRSRRSSAPSPMASDRQVDGGIESSPSHHMPASRRSQSLSNVRGIRRVVFQDGGSSSSTASQAAAPPAMERRLRQEAHEDEVSLDPDYPLSPRSRALSELSEAAIAGNALEKSRRLLEHLSSLGLGDEFDGDHVREPSEEVEDEALDGHPREVYRQGGRARTEQDVGDLHLVSTQEAADKSAESVAHCQAQELSSTRSIRAFGRADCDTRGAWPELGEQPDPKSVALMTEVNARVTRELVGEVARLRQHVSDLEARLQKQSCATCGIGRCAGDMDPLHALPRWGSPLGSDGSLVGALPPTAHRSHGSIASLSTAVDFRHGLASSGSLTSSGASLCSPHSLHARSSSSVAASNAGSLLTSATNGPLASSSTLVLPGAYGSASAPDLLAGSRRSAVSTAVSIEEGTSPAFAVADTSIISFVGSTPFATSSTSPATVPAPWAAQWVGAQKSGNGASTSPLMSPLHLARLGLRAIDVDKDSLGLSSASVPMTSTAGNPAVCFQMDPTTTGSLMPTNMQRRMSGLQGDDWSRRSPVASPVLRPDGTRVASPAASPSAPRFYPASPNLGGPAIISSSQPLQSPIAQRTAVTSVAEPLSPSSLRVSSPPPRLSWSLAAPAVPLSTMAPTASAAAQRGSSPPSVSPAFSAAPGVRRLSFVASGINHSSAPAPRWMGTQTIARSHALRR